MGIGMPVPYCASEGGSAPLGVQKVLVCFKRIIGPRMGLHGYSQ